MADVPTMRELRELATQMARVNPNVRKALRPILEGGTTAHAAMPTMRRQVRTLLEMDSPRVSATLRLALLEWARVYGTRTRGNGDSRAQMRRQAYLTPDEVDLIERAAKQRDMAVSAFLREAGVAAAAKVVGVD